MAIQKAVQDLLDTSGPPEIIVVSGSIVQITAPVAFEASKAAAYLGGIPPAERISAVEDLLQHGATAAALAQTSAHLAVMESRVSELTSDLKYQLSEQLKDAGENSNKTTEKLLGDYKVQLGKLLEPLTNPNDKAGLPAKMVELLDLTNRQAMKQIAVMLTDGEEGALAKAVKTITDQVEKTGMKITQEMAARQALLTKSNLRGGRFEEVLAARLPVLARVMGRVEPCSKTAGDKAGNSGDYKIVLDTTITAENVSLAVEAKSYKNKLGVDLIRSQLKAARLNRGSVASVLVADSAAILPGGMVLGQVSDCDFFAAFNPEDGDETALTCALFLAKAAAMATVTAEAGDDVDFGAVQREIGLIRGLMEQFSKLEQSHSRVDKEIGTARNVAADLKQDVLAALRRLDGLLTR